MVYANHWLGFQSYKLSLKLVSLPVLKAYSDVPRKSFELTREDIKKLRDKVQGNEQRERKVMQLLCCRSTNYFGNCVSGHGKAVKASDVVDPENGIAYVADKLSDLVKGL
ncbi:hypothetical protein WN944_019298 [Citrus x changshan-huyou]|uniref:Uncharacterized protein n=1 Tax=Citrus x changshan-huyou TaxID=2935761 RepID=A0AAP0LZM4_9ROSI